MGSQIVRHDLVTEQKHRPCGALLGTNPFCVPHFLFGGNRLNLASVTFLSSKGQIQIFASQGREGTKKQREGTKKQRKRHQETTVLPWDRILVPQEIYITIPLCSSLGNKASPSCRMETSG